MKIAIKKNQFRRPIASIRFELSIGNAISLSFYSLLSDEAEKMILN